MEYDKELLIALSKKIKAVMEDMESIDVSLGLHEEILLNQRKLNKLTLQYTDCLVCCLAKEIG